MVGHRIFAAFPRLLFFACFMAMLVPVTALALWIVISTVDWVWPLPRIVAVYLVLLTLQIIALIVYFKKPWIAAAVAWLAVILIVSRAIPWTFGTVHFVVEQFGLEGVYFVAAHGGLLSYWLMRRMKERGFQSI